MFLRRTKRNGRELLGDEARSSEREVQLRPATGLPVRHRLSHRSGARRRCYDRVQCDETSLF